jgi:hypothetical protein
MEVTFNATIPNDVAADIRNGSIEMLASFAKEANISFRKRTLRQNTTYSIFDYGVQFGQSY